MEQRLGVLTIAEQRASSPGVVQDMDTLKSEDIGDSG
jgi:hypothetical protein